MNFQKIALKKLIYDKDIYLLSNLSIDMFSKQYRKIFNVIQKYYLKYNKIIDIDVLKSIFYKNFDDETARLLEAIIDSLVKIKENLNNDELLYELNSEHIIYNIDKIVPELIGAIKRKEIDEIQKYIQSINSHIVKVDTTKTKDIKNIDFTINSLANVDVFLSSMQKEGFKLSGLSIIGGSSGAGKSLFALNQALYTYKQGHKVSILSLELPIAQVLLRLYSMETNSNYKELLAKDKEEVKEIIDKWRKDFFKDDTFYINYFRYDVSKIKETILFDIQRGVKLFVIDYLNLVRHTSTKEEWKSLADLIKELHDIAMSYGVVILSPTQVDLIENKDKRVNVTTRGTKELEYSSSAFLLIYQNQEEYKEDIARIIVKKSRGSRKFTSVVNTNFDTMKFVDTGIILNEV